MTFVRFLPEALEDVIEIQLRYAGREPGLQKAITGAIAAAVERIVSDPASFPCVHGPVRRLVVRRFPYAVYHPITAHPVHRRKKLIKVAIPLGAINAASAREKSTRHGHPGTMHLWWAGRPLAAARALIFCQMVDDPSAVPEEFPTAEKQENKRLGCLPSGARPRPMPTAGALPSCWGSTQSARNQQPAAVRLPAGDVPV